MLPAFPFRPYYLHSLCKHLDHSHMHMYACTHTQMHTHACMCMHTCTHTHACTHTCARTHAQTHTHTKYISGKLNCTSDKTCLITSLMIKKRRKKLTKFTKLIITAGRLTFFLYFSFIYYLFHQEAFLPTLGKRASIFLHSG